MFWSNMFCLGIRRSAYAILVKLMHIFLTANCSRYSEANSVLGITLINEEKAVWPIMMLLLFLCTCMRWIQSSIVFQDFERVIYKLNLSLMCPFAPFFFCSPLTVGKTFTSLGKQHLYPFIAVEKLAVVIC